MDSGVGPSLKKKQSTEIDVKFEDYENDEMKKSSKGDSNWNVHKETSKARKRWSSEEDEELTRLVNEFGTKNWRFIASHLPGRLSKQCRERWFNQLDPHIKKDTLTPDEWKILCESHSKIGNRWADIVKFLPGRTANQIKNFWNTMVRRKSVEATKKRKFPDNDWIPSKRIDFGKNENLFDDVYNFKNRDSYDGNDKSRDDMDEQDLKSKSNTSQTSNIGMLPTLGQLPMSTGYYVTPYFIHPVVIPGLYIDPSQIYSPPQLLSSKSPNVNSALDTLKRRSIEQLMKLSPVAKDFVDGEERSDSATEDDDFQKST